MNPNEIYSWVAKYEIHGIKVFQRGKGDGSYRQESFRSAIEKYIRFYNYERFQGCFGGRTPIKVRTKALNSYKAVLYPIPANKRIQQYKEKHIT